MSNTEAPPRDPHDRDPLDKSTIDCWRANYGLDKRTPAQAAKWWSDRLGGFAPSGCVAALGVALDELEALRALAQPAETDAELERRTGEPHVDGWPLYSGLPPAASGEPAETYDEWYSDWIQRLGHPPTVRDAWNATAPPAPALVPLTDSVVSQLIYDHCKLPTYAGMCAFARAIEAAHGIAAPDAPQSQPQR